MTYSEITLGSNLSQFVQLIHAQHEAMRGMERGAVEPTIKPNGLLWHRTDYPALGAAILLYNGSAFQLLMDPEFPQVNAGGTVPFAADQAMGGNILTDLGDGAADGESVHYGQVILTDGANDFTADQSMGGFRLTDLGAPSDPGDAARLADVGGTAFFRTAGGTRIDSGWDVGTTNFVQRINETPFTPEAALINIRGFLKDADDGDTIETAIVLSLWIPRWRHEASNGGVFYWYGGDRSGPVAGTGRLLGEFNNADSGSWDWKSGVISGTSGRDWRVYVRFHTAGTKGVEFWLRRESGEYIDIDEVGGGADGVVQMMVLG